MEDGVKRAVTGFVFNQRRLSFAKVLTITTNELGHIPTAPDPYWLPPLDGTLVKSNANETVYVTQDGARRPRAGQAFASRYRFSDIKILPQAEIETISPGLPVFN
jgi:hypothetical protein